MLILGRGVHHRCHVVTDFYSPSVSENGVAESRSPLSLKPFIYHTSVFVVPVSKRIFMSSDLDSIVPATYHCAQSVRGSLCAQSI